MDIIKLKTNYLKKINKTASELNRRLSFLNEINNTISQNNMIGGSSKLPAGTTRTTGTTGTTNSNSAAGGMMTSRSTGSLPTGDIDVNSIIATNTSSIDEIKRLIIQMKTKYNKTEADLKLLQADSDKTAELIRQLSAEKLKLETSINTVSSTQSDNETTINKLKEENKRYMDSIRRLSEFVNTGVSSIKSELTK